MPLPTSANADALFLYGSVPQYIQDWDANNGYQLLGWLNGVGAMLQPVDNLVRDDNDSGTLGWGLLFNYNYYKNLQNLTDVQQALVILPWLAQFVGTRLPQIPYSILNLVTNVNSSNSPAVPTALQTYINSWVTQIQNFNGFQRGTVSAALNQFVVFLNQLQGQTYVVNINNITILEQTGIKYTPGATYVQDPYVLTIIVPSIFIPASSYAAVFAGFTTAPATYSGFFTAHPYSIYSAYPNSLNVISAYLSFIMPAGIVTNLVTY